MVNSLRLILTVFLALTLGACQFSVNKEQTQKNNKSQDSQALITPQVIYGEDGRRDIHEVTDPFLLKVARSTVALFDKDELLPDGEGNFLIQPSVYGDKYRLCEDEPFFSQPSAAFCSGFLVEGDIVVTAGHCVEMPSDCSGTYFVFGYETDSLGVSPETISASDVYECAEIIQSEVEFDGADFAVLRLKRSVQDRDSLVLRTEGVITSEDPVLVIGHPAGLPLKVTLDGKVRSVEESHFVTNLDTYGGNSGSAVFNIETGEVEGILVRGARDFTRDYENSCNRSNYCTEDGCRGEDVTLISEVLSYIPRPVIYRSEEVLRIPGTDLKGVRSSIASVEAINGRRVFVEVNVNHSWVGNLIVKLHDPTGKVHHLPLSSTSYDNLTEAYGRALPALSDVNVSGTWTLQVIDTLSVNGGELEDWALHIK